MTRTVVQCDGAAIPRDWARECTASPPILVNRIGPAPQVGLRLQELSDPLAGTLEGRAHDLVSIASYVYIADQLVSRGGPADVYGDNWRREFAVCIPVGEPDFWNDTSVRTLLEQTVSFVSGEPWQFAFCPSHLPEQLALDIDQRGVRHNPDSVVLFSGGMDSLCAAVASVLDEHLRPVLVSHRSVPFMDHSQRALVEELRKAIPAWQFPHSKFVVNKVNTTERDTTQRTRSFLFAALGAAVASSIGAREVILADNGVVSLNLPINDQLLGSTASRSTHPKFLDSFNAIARSALPNQPQLRNPLWAYTKAEGLEILRRHGVSALSQLTNSCSHRRGLSNQKPHCGVCSQCIDRRFASLAAGLGAFDPPDRYVKDIFRDPLDKTALTMAESHLRFARKVTSLPSLEALYLEYPQLGQAILPDDPTPDKTATELASLVQRHARSVIGVVARQLEKASTEVASGILPATCLICLSLPPAIVPGMPQQLPLVAFSEEEEQGFKQNRFKCRLPVNITGQAEGRKSNVVTIGGHEVILPDAEFKLFFRLVVALFESPDGFVDRGKMKHGGGLADEGVYFPEMLDQAVGRLRWRLGPALIGLKATEYIEVRRGRIRISTHRAFVSVNREALRKHPDSQIRSLAARLDGVSGREAI